ncbi:hypothetical protein Nepgr_011775 [Nepenthes gracilis]|uniref:Uncharacterized protein n=1 Tax=Nepenthes gracilis TaxID=150966 RepID=A0AAD3SFX0_NEPGR|nr:hypothetical protein Nepgr_011775 [Nepenthes gracilis]
MCAVWNWSLPRRDAHPIARRSASTASPNNGRAAGISAASAIVGCRWRRFRAEAESELNSILKKTTWPKGFPPAAAKLRKPVTWRPPICCVSDSSGISLSLSASGRGGKL